MIAHKDEILSGWGNTPSLLCQSFRPEKLRELKAILFHHGEPLLARGLGRSYGDAALQPKGTIRMERLNRFTAFDITSGILSAQAGVTLQEVMELTIPQGWLLAAIPGTCHVTLGGAFACNVHGKNHYKLGEFAEHVKSIRIRLADGSAYECSPTEHADLFWATSGGMGMTGIIEEITLQLIPITSASLMSLTRSITDIRDMVAAFRKAEGSADYMVGWIDHMAKGDALGRGVFEAAAHISPAQGGTPLAQFNRANPRARCRSICHPSCSTAGRWRFTTNAASRVTRIKI